MARLSTREDFRCYVLSKLGEPLVDVVLQKDALDTCAPATTGTTGTSGTPVNLPETPVYATTGSGTAPTCQNFSKSVCSQLDLAIDDSLDYFQNFASELGNEKAMLYVELKEGETYYDVPPCVVVIDQDIRRGTSYQFDSEEASEAVGLFSLQSQFGPRGVFSYLGAGGSDTLLTYEIAWQYNEMVNLRYTNKFVTEFLELEKRIMILPTPSKKDAGKVIPYMCNIKVSDEKCFSHLWVQRYAVALTMEQIGRNLSMYTGMQFPNGGDFNSTFYWDMGREEKEKLEEELMSGKYGNSVAGGFFLTG